MWCGNEHLGSVNIKRGIFQGNWFSPLPFIIALTPLSMILSDMKAGYMYMHVLPGGSKLNHYFIWAALHM